MGDHENGSKKWMVTVRIIMILLGLIQAGLIGWAKYITNEVINNKSDMASTKSDLSHVKEDVSYIRERLDNFFDRARRP